MIPDQYDEPESVLPIEDFEEDFEVPDDGDSTAEDDRSLSEDDCGLSEDDVPVESFTAPEWDDLDFESDHEDQNTNVKFGDSWILLWILKYQARFRLPDVAIDSLVKFFRMVLLDADHTRFEDFPTSSYMMRKLLEIGKQSKTYAVCPDCNKLYKISEILSHNPNSRTPTGIKCNHIEFPNHLRNSKRQPCGAEITMKVPVVKDYVIRPRMVYSLPSLKTQLTAMYQRPGFESLLRKWTNRNAETGLMSDIYDGEI